MKLKFDTTPTSFKTRVKLMDSTKTTGEGLTGLTFNSAGLIIAVIQEGEATTTPYTQVAGNIETIATLGTYAAPTAGKIRFKEVDAVNHKGLYEIQVTDARFAGASEVIISFVGAADLAEQDIEIQIESVTVTTNNDKTGYTVSGTVVTDAASRTASKADVSNLDVAVSSRSTLAAGAQMDLVNAPNATAITAIQAGLATAAIQLQIKGAIAGKSIINAAGTQIKMYDFAGALLVTLDRSLTAPWIWTPTWA